ncbi:MAG: glycosyltransferase, partial [Chitinophagaceae bacterium]
AKGEFFAIFDADFLPAKDFLQKTIFYFSDPSVGMVQTKWGHINKQSSLLANLQAIALDGHFSVEQRGRNDAGYFINFNGTAGVWRKETILDSGNWQDDTLTEDFDLSYRAQMKGWKFKYLEDVITFGELPPAVSALKSQQFRWTKGGTETAKKHLTTMLASNLPSPVKGHAVFHLIYSFGFISILACSVLTVPIIFIKANYPQYNVFFKFTSLLAISFLIYIVHYLISFFNNTDGSFFKKIFSFIIYFPLFVSLFIGLSLSNAYGILQGYFGIKSSFIRTPKFNSITGEHTKKFNKYLQTKLNWLIVTEGLLIFYFLFGLSQSLYLKVYGNVPLLLMAFIGFSMVFWWSVTEAGNKIIPQ